MEAQREWVPGLYRELLPGRPAVVRAKPLVSLVAVTLGLTAVHLGTWFLVHAYRGSVLQIIVMVLVFVLAGAGNACYWWYLTRARAEKRHGYTTLYRGVPEVDGVDHRTGAVIRVAGEPELDGAERARREALLKRHGSAAGREVSGAEGRA